MEKNIDNQIDNNLSDTEQFIIKINDIKTNMGMWYSLFLRRILPFLIYIIPMNVVLENSYNIRIKTFADDKKNHIERGESGRRVRKSDSDFFFG